MIQFAPLGFPFAEFLSTVFLRYSGGCVCRRTLDGEFLSTLSPGGRSTEDHDVGYRNQLRR